MTCLAFIISLFATTLIPSQVSAFPILSTSGSNKKINRNSDLNDPQSPIYKNPNFHHSPDIGNDDSRGSMLISFIFGFLTTLALTTVIGVCLIIIYRNKKRLSEDELAREEENQAYMELDLEEQELFFQSKDYLATNPYIRNDLTLSQNLSIQEKGVRAWEFVKDMMLTNNDLMILNRFELNFFKKFECSTQTNLPVPLKNDVYYFESKIYSLPDPENTLISIGLAVKPYPWFRLPGRHIHSISYDSTGYRRYNQPFKFTTDPVFPKLIKGDVIGVGYRVRSGTVFFTRNGKKVSELKLGGHIKNFRIPDEGQIFPTIGANNLCSVHVNLGQMGYVFIEGNVKKWGFAPLEGNGPAPPAYNKFNADILLERSEVEDDDDLLERENDFPPNFWEIHGNGNDNSNDDDDNDSNGLSQDKFSYSAYSDLNSNDERITLNSLLPPHRPPSYNSEDEEDEDGIEHPTGYSTADTNTVSDLQVEGSSSDVIQHSLQHHDSEQEGDDNSIV